MQDPPPRPRLRGVSDPFHDRDGSDGRLVLAVVRRFTELMLTPPDPEQGDADVSDALLAGLRVLVPAADVVRTRFRRRRDGELAPRAADDLARLRELGATDEALVEAVEAADLVERRRAGGELISLFAPLAMRTGAIDLFVVRASAGARLADADAHAFSTLRDLATATVVARRAHDEARVDALTGCLNHGAMLTELEQEVARAERAGSELACVMLDLDEFKAVNERHGHQAGDELLAAVSENLLRERRRSDSCCRYGGDEFLVILPNSDIGEAERAAERMRSAVALATIRHDGAEIAVTATTGVAVWRTGDSPADLIARADDALLRGKGAKRDDRRAG